MKKAYLLLFIAIPFFFISCEEVIDVDLTTADPKLVVEAAINWEKGTTGNDQVITLTTTTGYYSDEIPTVSGATITVTNSSNTVFTFAETPDTGKYYCTNFEPVLNETYTLTISINGETYTATETLYPVAEITTIEQDDEGGFDGKTIEIKSYFNDPEDEDNYYMYKYTYTSSLLSDYYVDSDQFFQGNEFYSISQSDELEKDDTIQITHYGISKTYYNYMDILISISGSSSGSPFQTASATVRGNIINQTDFDNYALGYFSLSETDTEDYTVQ
jgi:hypothetical protein